MKRLNKTFSKKYIIFKSFNTLKFGYILLYTFFIQYKTFLWKNLKNSMQFKKLLLLKKIRMKLILLVVDI